MTGYRILPISYMFHIMRGQIKVNPNLKKVGYVEGKVFVFFQPAQCRIFSVIVPRIKGLDVDKRCSIQHIHLFNVNDIAFNAKQSDRR